MSQVTAEKKPAKGKLAIYWAASCGGCEISILQIDAKILDVDAAFDLVFCPCIADGKVRDIEKMADGEIDVCLFNGGIRNSEQEYMARLLRRKSKVLVAFGSCASEGCIPGLGNLDDRKSIFATVYDQGSATTPDNPQNIYPQHETQVPEGTLYLPVFYDTLKTLAPDGQRRLLPARLPAGGRQHLEGDRGHRRPASCRPRARPSASIRPSATSASGRRTRRRSRSSTAPGKSFPTTRLACWSRA